MERHCGSFSIMLRYFLYELLLFCIFELCKMLYSILKIFEYVQIILLLKIRILHGMFPSRRIVHHNHTPDMEMFPRMYIIRR